MKKFTKVQGKNLKLQVLNYGTLIGRWNWFRNRKRNEKRLES
jgi:hypothetical protein